MAAEVVVPPVTVRIPACTATPTAVATLRAPTTASAATTLGTRRVGVVGSGAAGSPARRLRASTHSRTSGSSSPHALANSSTNGSRGNVERLRAVAIVLDGRTAPLAAALPSSWR
ncbi:hypothetical protein ACWEFJ_14785 [Actinosynnema sp. NPDC004786]